MRLGPLAAQHGGRFAEMTFRAKPAAQKIANKISCQFKYQAPSWMRLGFARKNRRARTKNTNSATFLLQSFFEALTLKARVGEARAMMGCSKDSSVVLSLGALLTAQWRPLLAIPGISSTWFSAPFLLSHHCSSPPGSWSCSTAGQCDFPFGLRGAAGGRTFKVSLHQQRQAILGPLP
ncbi:hypothetical protein KIL84_022259 [Mauremys mutica]|uniref:Uncharacterized protein n=1 Tax=Mauremys mutica TaxID=74926 RepID=A0A9D3X5H6_9SAUR|nr:hypothetical protein KIL84_022259 [Mauremys mutica]